MKKHTISRWIIHVFTVIFILFTAASATVNYYIFQKERQDKLWERAMVGAALMEATLSDYGIADLHAPVEKEIYDEIRLMAQEACKMLESDYLYIYSIDTEKSSRYCFLCVSTDETKDGKALEQYTLTYLPDSEITEQERAVLAGDSGMETLCRKGMFGEDEHLWIIRCSDGAEKVMALVGIAFNDSATNSALLKTIWMDIIPFVTVMAGGLLILLFLVRRRIIRPLQLVSGSMKRYAQDTSRKPEPLQIPLRDEIGEIADSYERMTENISTYVNNIEALTRENLENSVQLDVARRIQSGMVPEKNTLTGEEFRIAAITRPAREVGGDFYDFFRRDDGSVCLVMGDVSGKGITAALFMVMAKTMIREKLIAGLGPADTLNLTNDELCVQNPEKLFATVFLAVLNPHTGEVRYVNAGHTQPLLLGAEPAVLKPESGIAIGLFENVNLREGTLTLAPSEGILLYTDGVTEALNPEKHFFGMKRLTEAVQGVSGRADPVETLKSVKEAVLAFSGGCDPFDDMAILAAYRRETTDGRQQPVSPAYFEDIKKKVIRVAGDTPESRRTLLACDEVLENIVTYARAEHLDFTCEVRDRVLLVFFRYDGIPYDAAAMEPAEQGTDGLAAGLDLRLTNRVALEKRYTRRDDRNILSLAFPL